MREFIKLIASTAPTRHQPKTGKTLLSMRNAKDKSEFKSSNLFYLKTIKNIIIKSNSGEKTAHLKRTKY